MKPDDVTNHQFVLDTKAAQDLRNKLKQDPQAGLKQAAQQFEAMFVQMVMKSMREATPQDGPFDSDATRFYTSVLDQQMAQQLGKSGQLGFAKQIEQQLGRYLAPQTGDGKVTNSNALSDARTWSSGAAMPAGGVQGAARNYGSSAATGAAGAGGDAAAAGAGSANARDFVNRIWPNAVEASRATGVPAQYLVAHAALESGWGRNEIKQPDGSSSYNLFGVKAGRNWTGASVEATTTEYVNGVAQTTKARFRAYGSYAEAFRDYANVLASNPRFSGVVGQQDGTAFARSLQQAGYATDPAYADKLSRIIYGNTLRQALVG